MQNNLLNVVLALDAYNRGYNSSLGDQINGLGAPGSKIANMTMLNISLPLGSQNAGFYAAAYKNDDTDEIIISYRGRGALIGREGFGSDLWNVYSI